MIKTDGLPNSSGGGFSVDATYLCNRDRRYYFRDRSGNYLSSNETDIKRRLGRLGFSEYPDSKAGQLISDMDNALADISEINRVDYAAPIAGYSRGILELGSERYLITKELTLLEPKKGDWKILEKFLEGLFCCPDGEGVNQLPYVYGWLSVALEGLYAREPNKGQVLIIAGAPNCGKTLFARLLRSVFGGRVGKPYPYMVGETRFNDELFESSLLVIDDEADKTDIKSRRHLVAEMKKIVAGDGMRGEGKGAKAFEIQPHWRIVQLSNFEQDNLRVLPPLDNDIIGKLIILRGYENPLGFPMPVGTWPEKKAFLDAMLAELPAFIHYLIKEHEIEPAYREDRYGVESYISREVSSRMDQITPWFELFMLFNREVIGRSKNFFVGTASDMVERLRARDSVLTPREKDRYTPHSVGRLLAQISKIHPRHVWQVKTKDGRHRLWIVIKQGIVLDEAIDIDIKWSIDTYAE